ncbi:MAG: hypothetical protein JSS32_00080 [Verrucomicrobia bacterium]|nr:hypothetical protein [Verrucomicrobiota bacterium]
MSLRTVSGDFSSAPVQPRAEPSANKPLVNVSFSKYSAVYKNLTGRAIPLFNESSASPSEKAILALLREVVAESNEEVVNEAELNDAVDEVLEQFKSDPSMCRKVLTEAKELGSENLVDYFDEVLTEIEPVEMAPKQSTPWLKMLGVGILIAAIAIPVILSGTQTPKHNGPVYGPDMKLVSGSLPEAPKFQEIPNTDLNTKDYDYRCPNTARITAGRMATLQAEYESWQANNPSPSLVAEIPESVAAQGDTITISFGKEKSSVNGAPLRRTQESGKALHDYWARKDARLTKYENDRQQALDEHYKPCSEERAKRFARGHD